MADIDPTMDALLAQPPRFTSRPPRFNHVAMSVPRDLLDEAHRRRLVDFYTRVFGFTEYPMMTIDRERLVFGAYATEQFVFLVADDHPMTCPRLDHFGMSVGSMADLDDLLARCRAYQALDDRVDIIDKHVDDYEVVAITAFYVRYLLPLMIEVQHWTYADPSLAPK